MAGTIKYEYSPLEDIFVIYSQAAEYRLKSSLSRSGYPPRVDGLGVGGGKVIYLHIDVLQTGIKLVYGINMENTDTTREFAATDVFGSLSEALVEYEHRVSGGTPVKTLKQYVYYAAAPLAIHNIMHNLGRDDVVVAVYDEHNFQIIPHEVIIKDENNIQVTFDQLKVRCKVVVVAGVDLDSKKETNTNTQTMKQYVYQSSTPSPIHTIKHNLGSEDIGVFVYDDHDRQIIPHEITILDENSVEIKFGGDPVNCKALIVAGIKSMDIWEVK